MKLLAMRGSQTGDSSFTHMGNGFMCDTLGPQTWEAGLGQWFLELHSHPIGFSSKAGNSLSCWGEECGSDRGPGLWKALGAGRPRGQMSESADFQGRGPQAQAHWTAGGGWGQRVPD